MILEPWKSSEEIDRRLAALNDPELAELLRKANRELLGEDAERYTAPSAPYWNKRVAFIALAGLCAMTAGFSASVGMRERPHSAPKPRAAAPLPLRHRATRATHRVAAVPPVAVHHHAAPVVHRATIAVAPAAPTEALVRREHAQLLHEQALAAQAEAQARAEAARAHHQAQLAAQAQAEANAQALREAIAQARAQARAEAIAQARADAAAREQAQRLEQEQQQALLDNATDPNTKPGYGVPTGPRHMDTLPVPSAPAPVPGPIDPNCTPHRGSLFVSALSHVRVGGTNLGAVINLIHGP